MVIVASYTPRSSGTSKPYVPSEVRCDDYLESLIRGKVFKTLGAILGLVFGGFLIALLIGIFLLERFIKSLKVRFLIFLIIWGFVCGMIPVSFIQIDKDFNDNLSKIETVQISSKDCSPCSKFQNFDSQTTLLNFKEEDDKILPQNTLIKKIKSYGNFKPKMIMKISEEITDVTETFNFQKVEDGYECEIKLIYVPNTFSLSVESLGPISIETYDMQNDVTLQNFIITNNIVALKCKNSVLVIDENNIFVEKWLQCC